MFRHEGTRTQATAPSIIVTSVSPMSPKAKQSESFPSSGTKTALSPNSWDGIVAPKSESNSSGPVSTVRNELNVVQRLRSSVLRASSNKYLATGIRELKLNQPNLKGTVILGLSPERNMPSSAHPRVPDCQREGHRRGSRAPTDIRA